MIEVLFNKISEDAQIPTKRDEDAGYDVYAICDPNQPVIIIPPHTTQILNTGIRSIIPEGYYVQFEERSSVGSKGIALRCGVFDSGYRGEWKVALTNTNDKPVVFVNTKYYAMDALGDGSGIAVNGIAYRESECVVYPLSKAVVQFIPFKVLDSGTKEVSDEEFEELITSERGVGGFGSTGK